MTKKNTKECKISETQQECSQSMLIKEDFMNEITLIIKKEITSHVNAINGKIGASTQKYNTLQEKIKEQEKIILEQQETIRTQNAQIIRQQAELTLLKQDTQQLNDLYIEEQQNREREALQNTIQKNKTLPKLRNSSAFTIKKVKPTKNVSENAPVKKKVKK
jgi:septal ring factor EnvC (AmiA/AmiB activator)